MGLFQRYFIFTCSALLLLAASVVNADLVKAPAITVRTDTGELSLEQMKGQVLYVDFWASWCGPCRKSFPWMNTMQQRYGDKGLKIIAINVDSDPALAKRFLQEHKSNFTIAYDENGKAASVFNVKGMPNSYLIDRDGNIQSTHIGFLEKDTNRMEAAIKALVNK